MQPARLSEMINGKREMPEDVEEKIMDSLNVHEFPSAGIEFQDSDIKQSFIQKVVDMIQSRRYLGLRHKKRLIEDLKGLEL